MNREIKWWSRQFHYRSRCFRPEEACWFYRCPFSLLAELPAAFVPIECAIAVVWLMGVSWAQSAWCCGSYPRGKRRRWATASRTFRSSQPFTTPPCLPLPPPLPRPPRPALRLSLARSDKPLSETMHQGALGCRVRCGSILQHTVWIVEPRARESPDGLCLAPGCEVDRRHS